MRIERNRCARGCCSLRGIISALLVILSFVQYGRAAAVVQTTGNVTDTQVSSDGVVLTTSDGLRARVVFVAPDTVRIRYAPSGAFSPRVTGAILPSGAPPVNALIQDGPDGVLLSTSAMTVVIFKAPFRLTVLRPDGSVILNDAFNAASYDRSTGLVFTTKQAPSAEHYLGFGFRGGPLDRRGRFLLMSNFDDIGYGEFSDPLYVSIPFYFGFDNGKAYGLFFDNPATPFFDLDSARQGFATFGALAGELDYYLMAGPAPANVARAYARLTGTSPLPPKWGLGFQQSRFGYSSQQQFLDIAAGFRSRKIPADVLYFDLDYTNQLELFTWDPVKFPSPLLMNSELEAAGFKRVNIIDPVVHIGDPLWPFLDGFGMFIKRTSDGQSLINRTFFPADVSWLDFSQSVVRDWYKSVLPLFLATGVSGVWNDLNEPAFNDDPLDPAVFGFDGDPRGDFEARNLYALQETRASHEAQLAARPNVRPWVLSRSGYAGIQRYAANWSGDTTTSFDSLRVSVQISISMGLSGQQIFGHDIGGFLGSPTPELFIRWLQFGSFNGLFRTHSVNTSEPREPWAFGAPFTDMIRTVIEARYRLLPYTYSLFERAARNGTPALAPTVFYFPADPDAFADDSSYMWGENMLVAPVTEPGATQRNVRLPAGADWYDYHTDQFHPGGQTTVISAPLERLPLLVRAGSMVPFGPIMQYTSEPVPPMIGVDIYPGPDSTFDLYEDDGRSLDYQRGQFLRTRLSHNTLVDRGRLRIERTAGAFTPPSRPWELKFHAVDAGPGTVLLNATTLVPAASAAALQASAAGWFWDPVSQVLTVKFADVPAPMEIDVVPATPF